MRRTVPTTVPQMTLQELGLAVTSKAGCSPLLGEQVARSLLDVFNAMLAAGYELSIPQLCQPTRAGHTTWRIDIANPHLGFTGALLFTVPTIH